MNDLRKTKIFPLLLRQTHTNSADSTISYAKFLGLTHTGGEYPIFWIGAKCVCKYTPAHLFVNGNVSPMQTQNNPGSNRKAVRSTLQNTLHPLFSTLSVDLDRLEKFYHL